MWASGSVAPLLHLLLHPMASTMILPCTEVLQTFKCQSSCLDQLYEVRAQRTLIREGRVNEGLTLPTRGWIQAATRSGLDPSDSPRCSLSPAACGVSTRHPRVIHTQHEGTRAMPQDVCIHMTNVSDLNMRSLMAMVRNASSNPADHPCTSSQHFLVQ